MKSEADLKKESAALHAELEFQQKIFKNQFLDVEQQLRKLARQLELSDLQSDKDEAKNLEKILEFASKKAIGLQFDKLLAELKNKDLSNLRDLKNAQDATKRIADDIKTVINMLYEDPSAQARKEQQKTLEKIVKDIEKAIHNEKVAKALNENPKTDKTQAQKAQEQNLKNTKQIAKDLGGDASKDKEKLKGDSKGAGKNGDEASKAKDPGDKDQRAEAKPGGDKDNKAAEKADGKEGDKSAQAEGDKGDKGDKSAAAKSGDKSDKGMGEPKESKDKGDAQASAKDNKGDDKGMGAAKPGDPKDSANAKPGNDKKEGDKSASAKSGDKSDKGMGEPKESKGDPQASAKDNKGDPMSPQAGAKPGDPKDSAGAKPGSDKKEGKPGSGEPKDSKSAQAKEGKGGDKSAEAKAGSPKEGSPKAGEQSGQKSQSKPGSQDQAQAKKGADSPMSPMSPPSPGQQSQAKGDNQPPPSGQSPQQNQQQQEMQKQKKQIEEAGYDMQKALDEIAKNNKQPASEEQQKSIEKLEAAKKKLEQLLNQLREEELEQLLALLEKRCAKMLAMQIEVRDNTVTLDSLVQKTNDKKPTREHNQSSLRLADREGEIIDEADKAIALLKGEGSAVAFPEVFQQVREDMDTVKKRLLLSNTGPITVGVENDIIASLEEMIAALKKAKKDLDNKKTPPGGGSPPPPGQQDQKLLDQIAELKMIRSMQVRVNSRTTDYGRAYPGEQANDGTIRRELGNLGERQDRIFDIVQKIARGDNR